MDDAAHMRLLRILIHARGMVVISGELSGLCDEALRDCIKRRSADLAARSGG